MPHIREQVLVKTCAESIRYMGNVSIPCGSRAPTNGSPSPNSWAENHRVLSETSSQTGNGGANWLNTKEQALPKIACRLQTPGPLLLKSLFSPATFALIKTLALLHFESFTTFQLFNWWKNNSTATHHNKVYGASTHWTHPSSPYYHHHYYCIYAVLKLSYLSILSWSSSLHAISTRSGTFFIWHCNSNV